MDLSRGAVENAMQTNIVDADILDLDPHQRSNAQKTKKRY